MGTELTSLLAAVVKMSVEHEEGLLTVLMTLELHPCHGPGKGSRQELGTGLVGPVRKPEGASVETDETLSSVEDGRCFASFKAVVPSDAIDFEGHVSSCEGRLDEGHL